MKNIKEEASINIGILEFGKGEKKDSILNLSDVFEYAQKADSLGFSRFWLSEHHSYSPEAAWSTPETLIPIIAGLTNNISVGIAGVLLKLHSPYRVALSFKLLSNIFHDRIDLGLAKALPRNKKVQQMLNPTFDKSTKTLFDEKLRTLNKYFYNEKELILDKVVIPPKGGSVPNTWYLSRSMSGFETAIINKMNYSKSLFHPGANQNAELDLLFEYKSKFYKKHSIRPIVNIAIAISSAENDEKAKQNLISKFGVENLSSKAMIHGELEKICDEIQFLSEYYKVNEILILDVSYEAKLKIKNLEFLSDRFKLAN